MGVVVSNDNTPQVLGKLKAGIKDALDACGAACEGYAKAECPVDTGRLRNSITHQLNGDTEVQIGTNVEYGKFVETGTSKQRSQPYLKPAVQNHEAQYAALFKSIIGG